ncbi:hypothetical protein KUTeg_009997 [Tegillarca granosa]|uniref:C-type lectin domain-containing protein n=1 Tax=Tegillarca granosa TaxID=220873 RepID=A0ABQ9F5G9_TEGGR|nr:hypothetical protein KUTeg_009997 [Tegillarca granosa]
MFSVCPTVVLDKEHFECITIHGGYLVKIESSSENNFIVQEAKRHHAPDTQNNKIFFFLPSIAKPQLPVVSNRLINIVEIRDHNYGYWIGGSDIEVEGEYIWMKSKHPFDFTDWAARQPDNQRHEDCVHLNGNYGFRWNDAPCSLKAYYICEKPEPEVDIIG